MKITNPITLDVARSNSYICLLAKQFDENSRFLIATLTNNGAPMIIPAGAAVTLRATRPDGEPVAVPGIINNDGTTTVEIDDYILEVVGSASLSIEVAIGDEILTSASFNLTIQRADGNGWLRVYVAAASLAAGNYYITIGDTPYAFTTTQAIPAGGSIYFASEGGTAQTRDASGNVLDASLTLTAGTSGTELTSDVPTMSFLTAIAGRMATIEAEMSQKANIDGSYPLLNAGSADNLIADTGATQAIPFIQEGTGKGNGEATVKAGGVLQLKKKLGNTVCVNQLVPNAIIHITTTVANNIESYTWGDQIGILGETFYNHMVIAYANNSNKYCFPAWGSSSVNFVSGVGGYADTKWGIYKAVATGGGSLYWRFAPGLPAGTYTSEIYLFDVSIWFGSDASIPSHLLSHPEDWGRYYAGSLDYAAGYLDSADGTVMRSIGRNVWDEEWESGYIDSSNGSKTSNSNYWRTKNKIRIIPNTLYYFKCPTTYSTFARFYYYDGADNFIGYVGASAPMNNWFRTPANAQYMMFCTGDAQATKQYNHDITISLYYSGESGYDEYYPHSVLAEVDTGSEGLRSAGAVADEKTPDGTITRRVGVVDLGTLGWTAQSSGSQYSYYSDIISDIKKPATNSDACEARIALYLITVADSFTARGDLRFAISTSGRVNINDNRYTTAAAFKTAMNGVYLYYELATPTTEQGTAFAENIPCDPNGTLSWTQSAGVPQGNEIFYPADLKGALESIVAALPSANGTYTLHATVTTAGVTFSWS